MKIIILTKTEIQSNLNRQGVAEGLILQLPKNHEGRNTWLMNYGKRKEAIDFRKKKKLIFDAITEACEIIE